MSQLLKARVFQVKGLTTSDKPFPRLSISQLLQIVSDLEKCNPEHSQFFLHTSSHHIPLHQQAAKLGKDL